MEAPSSTGQTEGKADRAAKNLKLKTPGQQTMEEALTGSSRRKTSQASSQSAMFAWRQDQGARALENMAFENTYKMAPDKKFPIRSVKNILKEVLMENLTEASYEASACRQLSKTLSDELKNRVKKLNIQRYKVISMVYIGSLGSQAVRIGSRCLWDVNCDTYSSYEFKNNSLFAVAMVYGVYFE